MLEIANLLQGMWPVVISFVLLIGWGVRLELQVAHLKEQISHADGKDQAKDKIIWAKFDAFQGSLNSILQSVSRLEGRLEGRHLENN